MDTCGGAKINNMMKRREEQRGRGYGEVVKRKTRREKDESRR